jgi:hypothetical protein
MQPRGKIPHKAIYLQRKDNLLTSMLGAPTRLSRRVRRGHLDDAAPLPSFLFLESTPDAWNAPERPRNGLRVIPAGARCAARAFQAHDAEPANHLLRGSREEVCVD